MAPCRHTDEQELTIIKLTEMTRQPMAHPDQKSTPVNIPIAGNPDWEKIVDGAFDGPGKIVTNWRED